MTETDHVHDLEATTLRVAAVISELLADHEHHRWSECIELASEFTDGRWRAASDLAFAALTTYVDRRVIWSGPKGARLIRLPVKRRTRALEVA